VLVTGSSGQVGSELKNLIQNLKFEMQNYDFYFTDRSELDITSVDTLKSYAS